MAWYRRSRLAIDALKSITSKVSAKNPIFESVSRTRDYSSFGYGSYRFSSPFLRNSKFPFGFQQNQSRSSLVTKRFYYVDRYQVRHFRPRGPKSWFQNPRNVFIAVLAGSGLVITIYAGNLETIPYTKRTHFVLLSPSLERRLGETEFENMKQSFKGSILPAIHPESVRVRLIASEVVGALRRGLRKEQVWSDLHYTSEGVESPGDFSGHTQETVKALSENVSDDNWRREDEILDDRWIEKSRKIGQQKGKEPATSHLEGFNWEVLVVDEPVVNALCLPGGKIIVFTGLLKHFKSDAEVATIIGHEVAHAVARHAAEGMTKHFWFVILQLILYQFVMPDVVNTMSALFLKLPFSRRMEMEADYIGLLLTASAGYDPRVAPTVYEKLGRISGESSLRDYLSTHPSGRKRAKLLAQAGVMDEALMIYREVMSGKGVEGFL